MNFSISSLLITCIVSTLLIVLLNFLLTTKKNYRFVRSNVIIALSFIIIARLCLPIEYRFTKTIPVPFFMNPLMTFLTYPLILDIPIYVILISLWILGILFNLVRYIRELLYLNRMFKKLEEQSEICKIKNLLPDYNGNNYDVLITSYCDSPKVLGSKKVIILPNIHFEEDKLQIILMHEIKHIENHDYYIKQFVNFLTITYWWFPPVYILRKNIDLFLEIRVDEKVVKKMSERERLNYAQFLIHVQKSLVNKTDPFAKEYYSFLIDDSSNVLEYRIRYILEESFMKKTNYLLLVVICSLVFFSNSIIFEASFPAPSAETPYVTISEDTLNNAYIIQHKDGTYTLFIDGEQGSIEDPTVSPFSEIPIIKE